MGLMFSLMMLWACSSDDEVAEAPVAEREMPIELSASAVRYQEEEEPAANRRSWTPPSGYDLYSSLYEDNGSHYVNFANVNLANKSINAFFTRATDDEPNADDPTYAFYPYHGRLRYISKDDKWRLSINKVDPTKIKPGDYYVYGFIPSDAADDATITKLSGDFKNGATLTIKGLRTAGYDACVIIGAREGFDIDHDGGYTETNGNSTYDEGTDIRTNRLVAGDFKINLKTGESAKNYLYLLFDHLGSALSIGIKVDGDYNTLRTIKLKQLTLQTATESGLMAEKADVEVWLDKDGSGNPITKLTYTPTGSSGTGSPVYLSDEGLTLTTSYQSFLSHFLPITGVTKVVITCVYDVYDKDTSINPAGNLVRKDCKASNTIRLSDIIPYFPGVQRGWKYGINMTVKPTYLYVLSDPDLDNPTVSVE